MYPKPKFFLITTVPISLIFFKGQIAFLKNEFDVNLVSSPGEKLDEATREENVKSHYISMAREINLAKDIRGLFKFIRLFSTEKPELIHCNTPKGSLLSLFAGFVTGVPHRIYYVHGLRYQGALGFKKKLLMFLEKVSCFCATDIIAVSDGVRKVLNKQITKKQIKVIGFGSSNGLDLKSFNKSFYDAEKIRQELGISGNDLVFGFVGRLVGDKGINELVHSFKTLSDNHKNNKLVLIGNFENKLDPLKKSTLEEIQENKNIFYLGFQSDIKPYLAIFDVFVFPSYREGFGISLMEANAMGVPAISSDIIGCNEIIKDGINGFLIEPGNENELYKKMEYCIINKNTIGGMALNCREIIRSKYSQEFVWENSLNLYKEIANV